MREMKDSGVEWIGSIPIRWDAIPAGGLFTEVKEKNKTLKYTNALQFKFGTIVDKAHVGNLDSNLLDTLSTYTCVEPDTIILNGLNLNYDFVSQRVGIVTKSGVITSAYLAVYPEKKRVSPKYASYLLKAYDSIFVFHGMGSGVRKTLQWKDFKNLKFVLPPMETQITLIEKIDILCSKTDSLIQNVQTQIEKLKAYKQSLITEVVTKGLDPTVPMKDSGVEWIGEIPERWDVTRIKNLFNLRTERNSEADLSKVNLISLYTDLGVVQHSDIIETTGNRAVTAEGYKIVHKNDIVVNIILCWMGAVGMSKYNGVTSPAYDIYRPLNETNSEYYHYLFRTSRFNGECYRYGRGIMLMRWRTYSAEFRAIKVPCPPEEEQTNVVTFLHKKCAQIDRLIAIKQAKIEKLEQYKRSLIYECVTGKKEII